MREGNASLCGGCETLLDYATGRLSTCPSGEEKPTCMRCRVHCYDKSTRRHFREVMRRVGPHMLYRHPILTYHHMREAKRVAPRLERKQERLGAA